MSLYAYVRDGVVVSTGGLPRNKHDISGFDKMNPEKIKAYGYLPYTYNAPTYNPYTQKLGEAVYVVTEDTVVGTKEVVSLPSKDIENIRKSTAASVFLSLSEVLYKTDWCCLSDAGLSVEQEAAYVSLRADIAAVRSIIDSFSTDLLEQVIVSYSNISSSLPLRLKDFSVSITEFANKLKELLV